MNLNDFYIVATKILEALNKNDPTPNYQNLIELLNQIRNNPTPEGQKAINDIVATLMDQNKFIEDELNRIPHATYVIDRLKVTNHIGHGATSKLEKILINETYIAPTSVQKLISDISSMRSQLMTITSELDKFNMDLIVDESSPILSIQLSGDQDIESTKDLKSRLDKLEMIIHAFSRLSNEQSAFRDPRILSISKSSPLCIDIGNGATIIASLFFLSKAITWSMDRLEQSYDIRIKHEELKKSKHTNQKIEEGFIELEKEFTSDKSVGDYTTTLIKAAKPNKSNGSNEEIKKAVKEAIKEMLHMLDTGASFKVFLPSPEDQVDSAEPAKIQELSEISLHINESYREFGNKQKIVKQIPSSQDTDIRSTESSSTSEPKQ